ncbi:MAG: hypothetical protein K0S82_271 [Gaiellaceae bacterium]|jgi:hypothetical protein|nr:hypothetical protein [Gaiellaceae bacterium]
MANEDDEPQPPRKGRLGSMLRLTSALSGALANLAKLIGSIADLLER